MVLHHLKHLLSEIVILAALAFFLLAVTLANLALQEAKFKTRISAEQRRHPRYPVMLSGTFMKPGLSGLVKVGNLSVTGCKVESNVPISRGDFGHLLIDLPGCNAPLKVSQAAVRWRIGNNCGLEFLDIDEHEQGLLDRLVSRIGTALARA